MLALSWNCQGIGSSLTVRHLKELGRKNKLSIIFLMETKNKKRKLERIRRNMGYTGCCYVDPVGLAGGLCLWWSNDINIKIISKNKNIIDTSVTNKKGSHMLMTWVYGPSDFNER